MFYLSVKDPLSISFHFFFFGDSFCRDKPNSCRLFWSLSHKIFLRIVRSLRTVGFFLLSPVSFPFIVIVFLHRRRRRRRRRQHINVKILHSCTLLSSLIVVCNVCRSFCQYSSLVVTNIQQIVILNVCNMMMLVRN